MEALQAKSMKKQLFMLLFFGCFGMSTEIFFVAINNLIFNTPLWDEPLWSLTGKTYVWMLPIYMLIPVVGGKMMKALKSYPLLLRLLLYALAIFFVEFVSGFILEQITGKCPWKYTDGWNVCGYIKLEFLPAWMFFAFLIERLYFYLDENL